MIISLIPKVDSPSKVVDYRLIACCNTLCKCISKMLCVRLAKVLPVIVNQNQGAFIQNRSLAHNILIFQDVFKGYSRKNVSPRCVIKMDLSNAYGSIDWYFLEDLLKAYCFPSRFIHWIMVCLKGTSYTLLMNGRLQGGFSGKKNLRQGDPISPLLFILVMEYLTRLLLQATQNKDFRFHPLCKRLNLVNLYFADDLILFCKGSHRSVQIIHVGFTKFSHDSGFVAKLNKSHIYLDGVTTDEKKRIIECVRIEKGSFPLKYLGVPLRPTKCKAEACGLIIKKLYSRLHTWSSRHLSFAGRAQFIHSALLGTSLSSWDQVCLPKNLGGIGFKEGSKWNKILLSKYVWAISSKQDLLWVKWIDVVYLKGRSFWEYRLIVDVSWYWRKLVKLRDVLPLDALEVSVIKDKLNLSLLYNLLIQREKISFDKVVWCKLAVSKHRFILWQSVHGHLITRDNLMLCQKVMHRISRWLGSAIWPSKYSYWLQWMVGRPKELLQRIVVAAIAAAIYYIWLN
ncbi:uncharacterized protein LOC133780131 [Humulus lupulus]|uniref:uncharacterized protein LOC133780131 n=1 Tax=Humulus lupulus TaxID=3486 RepID=UPI002B40A8C3|nr:uncharacterized protein LOC133780131 [Humulus lupulus]